jgi:hypothetical protein
MRNMSDTFMDEVDYCKCSTAPNDQVERRGNAPTSNEADLSRSSTPSLAQRRWYSRDRSNRLLDPRATLDSARLPYKGGECRGLDVVYGWHITVSAIRVPHTGKFHPEIIEGFEKRAHK